MTKRLSAALVALFVIGTAAHFAFTDEGQWTPDQIGRLNLDRAGLRIPVRQIFNPGGPGLHEATLRLGGGTGEFVSPDGLIMTNHHVAFGAVARIATAERDYITDGYLARTRAEEIQARGYTARMVQLYEDITARVLGDVRPGISYEERREAIRSATSVILDEARAEHPDLEISVSSLWYGNTFKLIGFKTIRDIRIVYVPPFAVGNFGADTDNWMFPRHTGDFSFLRAYVAPDGSPASYSEKNVPYRPRSWLKVASRPPQEGDFVFLLGFPGTTMRYRDSHYVAYERQSRLPYEIMIRGERIDVMRRVSEGDRSLQIRFAETVKGLANVHKNYQGKVTGIDRMQLVARKQEEEAAWVRWYSSRPELRERYEGILESLEEIYAGMREDDPFNRAVRELLYSPVQTFATDLYEYLLQMELPEENRGVDYRGEEAEKKRAGLMEGPESFHLPVDRELYLRAAIRALGLPEVQKIATLQLIVEGQELQGYAPALSRAVSDAYATSPLLSPDGRESLLDIGVDEAVRRGGLFMQIAADVHDRRQEMGARQEVRSRALQRLRQLYAEGIMALGEEGEEMLYPDANRSLRFSYGYVKGYEPKDAVYIQPLTHLKGVMEKETGEGEFIVPDILKQSWLDRAFGRWADSSGDVPVNLLTNCDTTGGSSGSPVMNARGELIGINFDRVWEATANDYSFDPDFGRNISVHMHYILFICETFGAVNVLAEMGF